MCVCMYVCVAAPFLFNKDSFNIEQHNKDFPVMDPNNKHAL